MLFSAPKLDVQDREVLGRIDGLRTSLQHAVSTPLRWTRVLRRLTYARAIQGSNSIEGYNVSVEDAIAAVEGEEPLDAEDEAWEAVTGYRSAMTYVLQLSNDPHFSYATALLRSLHYMMLNYDLTKHPGKWRPGPIHVRNDATGEIVYEAPDAELVPDLMEKLALGLNAPDTTPAMVRAAMSHLNLVMIHPFSDGNGRMARCLQTLVLAREGILAPEFCSVEEYLGRNTQDYYAVLARVGEGGWHPENDSRPWIRFMLTAHFRQASTLLRRTKEMKRTWDELEREIQRRGLPDRVLFALAEAALGFKVRNSTYRSAAEVSLQVASRDLKLLADQGLLLAHGERRGRHYTASEAVLAIRQRVREPRKIPDPYKEPLHLPGLVPPS